MMNYWQLENYTFVGPIVKNKTITLTTFKLLG